MRTSMKKSRFLAFLSAAALVTTVLAVIPVSANAAEPLCDGKLAVNSCKGLTSDGAPYAMQVPGNFNGTVLIWSHGIRPNVPIPAAIPKLGGYVVTNTPETAAGQSGGSMVVTGTLLAKGYALMGSGFSRQGVNIMEGVATNVELIGIFKKQFPTTKKVIAWGESLGAITTQVLAEQHPELITAAGLTCTAVTDPLALASYFGDFLWGFKTFFDPTIKGFGYSAGAAGYAEEMGDLGKFWIALGKLQAGLVSGEWPDTSSPAGKALEAAKIPSRSALLLVGLMAGVPTRSAHIDGVSGPKGSEELFPLAIAPALAVLENAGTVASAAILLMADGEQQTGGIVFDNTKTDYAARIGDARDVFTMGLSGNTALNAMLGIIAASPRVTGLPAAVAKMSALLPVTGKIKVPTVQLSGVADQYTPSGIAQWLSDKNAAAINAAKAVLAKKYGSTHSYAAPVNNLVTVWSTSPAKYTTFDATGTPVLSTPGALGAGHCVYTPAQHLAVANLLIGASSSGTLLSGGALATLVRKAGGLSVDPKFKAPTLKYFG